MGLLVTNLVTSIM